MVRFSESRQPEDVTQPDGNHEVPSRPAASGGQDTDNDAIGIVLDAQPGQEAVVARQMESTFNGGEVNEGIDKNDEDNAITQCHDPRDHRENNKHEHGVGEVCGRIVQTLALGPIMALCQRLILIRHVNEDDDDLEGGMQLDHAHGGNEANVNTAADKQYVLWHYTCRYNFDVIFK